MATGIRIWDASGNLTVDTTDRLTRILGYTTLAASGSGTVTDDGFLTGSPFYIAIRSNGGSVFNGTTVAVSISFSGNQMSYSTSQSVADFIIVYGVY